MTDRRHQAIEVLGLLHSDILVGLKSLELFSRIDDKMAAAQKPLSDHMKAALARLSNTHLLLSLAKWMEFYKHYKDLIPPELRAAGKKVNKELENRGIRTFRNKFVGHIWDDDLGRPLSAAEVYQRLSRVIGPDEEAFNRWIVNPAAPDKTTHIVGLTEAIRDALKKL